MQEENGNLRRLCSSNTAVRDDSIGFLKLGSGVSFSNLGDTDSRKLALYTVVCTLITPFVVYKYLDCAPQMMNTSKRTKDSKEEVPLKKRIAYMVDVCFSVYPYAKLLALLFATLFLIGFGGLALYAVSDGSLTEALWLSWSFVADSGNHADMVGTGPRMVSVSISSGGMLIFAMMLGLVSDAISEKVDSLRKGKSEVIESNHILILGWSDKLVILLPVSWCTRFSYLCLFSLRFRCVILELFFRVYIEIITLNVYLFRLLLLFFLFQYLLFIYFVN